MRCAVRAPTPGRMRKASTRRASAGVKPMASLEWQIHARRQIQTTGQLRHLFLALRVDALHGIVDGGSHQIFQQFAVISNTLGSITTLLTSCLPVIVTLT